MRPRARGEDFGITCCISTRGNDFPHAHVHAHFDVTSFFLSHTCIYLHPYDFCLCSAKPIRVLLQFNELWSSAVNICVNNQPRSRSLPCSVAHFTNALSSSVVTWDTQKILWMGGRNEGLYPLSSTKLFPGDSWQTHPSHERIFTSSSSQMFPSS